eukprot:gene11025-14806_t
MRVALHILLFTYSYLVATVVGFNFLTYNFKRKYIKAVSVSQNCERLKSLLVVSTQSIADVRSKLNREVNDLPSVIVLIVGFEAFNLQLYKKAAEKAINDIEGLSVFVYTDQDIVNKPEVVSSALFSANIVLSSLIFDYNQVQWIRSKIQSIPYRFCFESALELMSDTSVRTFTMNNPGQNQMPKSIKNILKQFGSSKEEDKLSGYLNLLKVGPSILKFIPGDKVNDLRVWMTVYSYWNQGGVDNIVSMLKFMANEFSLVHSNNNDINYKYIQEKTETPIAVNPVIEVPSLGIVHPDLGKSYMSSPKEYIKWFEEKHLNWITPETPRVGILLYRKHVISEQQYIPNLIALMENERIIPIPVFINGVEGHTVVRELFTTHHEQEILKNSNLDWELSRECTRVDAIINTIGFPLVGGPAGSMESGRQLDISRNILTAKNVPYIVAAPLIIQETESWLKNGVQGLQSVVLYSLPELDGAIETVVLGGLVDGENIVIIPERVRKLTQRLKSWVKLRKMNPSERTLSILLYGFPPNVGSTGTAALLNVGRSLQNILVQLQSQGYDIGNMNISNSDLGSSIIKVLGQMIQDGASSQGYANMQKMLTTILPGAELCFEDITSSKLRGMLGKIAAKRIENQWGNLDGYAGISTSGQGKFRVVGMRFGKIMIGVQPLLGIEGDPMRMLFERNLTPHPQYAAYYSWLHQDIKPDCILHFGMHGTVEWLPGSVLGSTDDSWPEILLGNVPNIYLYACNNPSESILAKRRGYATIVSYNVPPYDRAGLYNELQMLKELLKDFRSDSSSNKDNSEMESSNKKELIPIISDVITKCGLYEDLPYEGIRDLSPATDSNFKLHSMNSTESLQLLNNRITSRKFILDYSDFIFKMSNYLDELESRLFSEGLYEIGAESNARQITSYLDALYENSSLHRHDLEMISESVMNGSSTSSLALIIISKKVPSDMIPTAYSLFFDPIDTKTASLFDWIEVINSYFNFQIRGISSNKEEKDKNFLNLLFEKNSVLTYSSDSKKKSQIFYHELNEAIKVAKILYENPKNEMNGLLGALNGEYVVAAPGGDIIRDGAAILPTGRNIYALDPYRIPSPLATTRGKDAVDQILKSHQQLAKSNRSYPSTVAVTLWGLDTIKTKGESVGMVLALVGARPFKEATGRVVKFEIIPLEELGRPRIDCLCSLSGIFRDSFGNVLDLLDDLFERLSELDEPDEMNYIKKHVIEFREKGVDRPTSRLFSNPPGEFGSMVNEQIGSGDWTDESELGKLWENRNGFSYGKNGEFGQKRPELLKSLLNTTEQIIQEIDCVEYGLTDIQEYFGNTGALKKAAENIQATGKAVQFSIVEGFQKQVKPKNLDETLRLEYRSKLLNPKWAEAMVKQGAGGVYEISGRITSMVGWAAVANFKDEKIFDTTAERYVLDDKMALKLKELNPEAFRNVLKRMLEINGRGYWSPTSSVLSKIRELYDDVDDEIEEVDL